jgi:hypothetical protein
MSFLRHNSKLVVVALCCLAAGAGASAIAGAGAATGNSSHAQRHLGAAHRGQRAAHLRRLAGHAVQGTVVLATRHGFKTVSFDRGTVVSVSGRQLTLTEGRVRTAKRNVTVTIPSAARVRDNRQAASLSALKAGQRVIVIRLPKQTLVLAHAARTAH